MMTRPLVEVAKRRLHSRYASDSLSGEFLTVTDVDEVRCGLCGLAFRKPSGKADHLQREHRARVVIVARPNGIEVYRWTRFPSQAEVVEADE